VSSASVPDRGTSSAARGLLQTVANHGVRFAFGIPGGLISPVFNALEDVPEIRLISTRHETMAAFCAIGSAVATGSPALILTTAGPGITNVATGVASALAEEIPLIVVSGEVSSSAWSRGAFQDSSQNAIDSVSFMRSITRWSARVDSAANAAGAAAQAMQIACGNRPGPVFLSVAFEVANATARVPPLAAAESPAPLEPSSAACAEVAAALVRARRPLLVLGNGARGASTQIRALAERLSCAVVTTPHAKGIFPESHRLHLGGIGFGGHPSATSYLASRPDVVCVIGSRLGDFATNGWSVPLEGREATFQIDRDPRLIGRNYAVSLGIVGDATKAVQKILSSLAERDDDEPPKSGVQRLTGIRRIEVVADAEDVGLHPSLVLRALQDAFPEAFWAVDIGEHSAHALHYLQIDHADQFRSMLGFGSMGSGIGVGMGVALTRPRVPTVVLCGDGGFAMHAGDLLTCVEQGIGCLFIVMNDGRWNIVEHGFQAVFGRVPKGMPSRIADLAGVARAFGAVGVTIDSSEHLRPDRLRALWSPDRPVVLDVRVDARAALSVATRSSAMRESAFGGAK
jgi:acetolactate synthase-1/2/3 large subunit